MWGKRQAGIRTLHRDDKGIGHISKYSEKILEQRHPINPGMGKMAQLFKGAIAIESFKS
jgi:hypothetical protein